MANKKISELDPAAALDGSELVELVQGGGNVKATAQDIADLATTSGGVTSINGETGNVTGYTKNSDINGINDLFIAAGAMWPRLTNGCAFVIQVESATSILNYLALDFDQATQEFAQVQIVIPRRWNGGTISISPYWTAASGSGGVVWGFSAVAYRNDDAFTIAFGTAQTSADTLITANDLHIGPATAAITVGGTIADAAFIAIQVSRNPADGSDTLNADARFLGMLVTYTVDAAKDA